MSLFCITMDKMIYMDNAATTRLYDEAFDAMIPFLKEDHANPGAIYEYADNAKRAVAKAREEIASTIGAKPNEIYFTCSGTEADNWALKGMAELAAAAFNMSGYKKKAGNDETRKAPHIITSAFEHHAVLNTCKWLERNGCRISYVKPDANGIVSLREIEKLICADTVLVSVMFVNNELGTIQQVDRIGALAHEHKIPFHTDAVAAYGHVPVNVKEMNIDLLSASGHKFNGPKGTGFLYIDEKYKPDPFMHGGGQEQGRRAGTENVACIAAMAAAAAVHHKNMENDLIRRRELDRYLIDRLRENDFRLGGRCGDRQVLINGCMEGRLPGSFNITIPGVEAEEVIVRLGMEGICVSAGAACASLNDTASHVLTAIGLSLDAADSSIRISMNEDNTEEEIDMLFDVIRRVVR